MIDDGDEITFILEDIDGQKKIRLTVDAPVKLSGQNFLDCLQSFIDDYKVTPDSIFEAMNIPDADLH